MRAWENEYSEHHPTHAHPAPTDPHTLTQTQPSAHTPNTTCNPASTPLPHLNPPSPAGTAKLATKLGSRAGQLMQENARAAMDRVVERYKRQRRTLEYQLHMARNQLVDIQIGRCIIYD